MLPIRCRRYFSWGLRCRTMRCLVFVIFIFFSLSYFAGTPNENDLFISSKFGDKSESLAEGTFQRNASERWPQADGSFHITREDLILDVSTNLSLVNASFSLFAKHDNIRFLYGDYYLRRPNFISEEDKRLFYMNSVVLDKLKPVPLERRRGLLTLVKDGVFIDDMNCGFMSKIEHFRRHSARSGHPRIQGKYLCPLIVPQSDSFQYFVEGVLPKLMQVYDFINDSLAVKLLVRQPKDEVIKDILHKLHFTAHRIVHYQKGYANSDIQINTCITPPMHPALWKKARSLLKVPDEIEEESFIVLLMREGSQNKNQGQMENNIEVMKFLSKRYKYRLRLYGSNKALQSAQKIFGKAFVIIGLHGGALYNMMFAPKTTSIIEIIPTNDDGSMQPRKQPITIFWELANMFEQSYWRLSEKPTSPLGNVMVNITKLEAVLNRIEAKVP